MLLAAAFCIINFALKKNRNCAIASIILKLVIINIAFFKSYLKRINLAKLNILLSLILNKHFTVII